MLTRRAAIKTVERFVREIKASGIQVRRAVLFDSYAHGKPHEWSDIDVAVVADEFRGVDDARYFSGVRIKPDYMEISTRTYNTKEFTPETDPFAEVILEKGIEIAC